MAWTDWCKGTHSEFPGHLVKINTDENPWIHYLVAPLDEPEPDKNHIHLKARIAAKEGVEWGVVENAYLVASVNVDGIRVINRRKLIEEINNQTGLNLQYT